MFHNLNNLNVKSRCITQSKLDLENERERITESLCFSFKKFLVEKHIPSNLRRDTAFKKDSP